MTKIREPGANGTCGLCGCKKSAPRKHKHCVRVEVEVARIYNHEI